jgi:hypothetical protein
LSSWKPFAILPLLFGLLTGHAQVKDSFTMPSAQATAGSFVEVPIFFLDRAGTLVDTGIPGNGGWTMFFDSLYLKLDVPHGILESGTEFFPAGVLLPVAGMGLSDFEENNQPGVDRLIWLLTFDGSVITLGQEERVGTLRLKLRSDAPGGTVHFSPQPDIQVVSLGQEPDGTESIENGWLSGTFGPLTVQCSNCSTPTITSFTASPASIQAGGSSTLSWQTQNADSVTLTPTGQTVAQNGSQAVSPVVTTQYTLTATNSSGSTEAFATVNVQAVGGAPTIVSFHANPATISVGGSSTLSWQVSDADAVSIDQGIGSVSVQGSHSVSPAATTIYQITATNSFGTSTANALLSVNSNVAPIVQSFTAQPQVINPGGVSLLSWNVLNAALVTINPGNHQLVGQGELQVSPSQTTLYQLNASNGFGSATAQVEVRIATGLLPAITLFTANPETIDEGMSTELEWVTATTDSVKLYADEVQVFSAPLPSGRSTVTPQKTTVYRLEALNAFGSSSKSITVTVNRLTVSIPRFTASPPALFPAQNTTVAWDVRNAASVSLTPGGTNLPLQGEKEFTLGTTTTFTLKGVLNSQVVSQSLTVPVIKGFSHQSILFPELRSGKGWQSSLGVVNGGMQELSLAYSLYEGATRLAEPQAFTLARGASQVFSPPVLPTGRGWAFVEVVAGPAEGLGGYSIMRSTDGEELIAIEAVRNAIAPLWVPHVAADPSFFTYGSMVHLGSDSRPFHFSSGQSFALGSFTSGEGRAWDFRELMGGSVNGPGWGSLEPASGYTAAGAVEIFGRVQSRQTVGVPLDDQAAAILYFPHLARDTQQFWTGVVLINPNDGEQTVSFAVYNDAGQLLAGIPPLQLQAQEKKLFLVDRQRQDFGSGASWLKVQGSQDLLGYMLFGSYDPDDRFAGFQSVKQAYEALCFPYIESAFQPGGYTGIALVNPNQSALAATLEWVDGAGNIKQTLDLQPELAAGQKFTGLVDVLFSGPFATDDKIVVRASQPVVGFELIGQGTKQLGGMLAIPLAGE